MNVGPTLVELGLWLFVFSLAGLVGHLLRCWIRGRS